MDIELEVIGLDTSKTNLLVNLNNKKVTIPVKLFSNEVRIILSPFYKKKLKQLEIDKGLSSKETLMYLLDFYYLDNSSSIRDLKAQLLGRIGKGVDSSFLIQLKLVYTALGHFLKKIRYI